MVMLGEAVGWALDEEEVQALAERLAGDVVRPGDEEYEQARAVWNAAVDRRPALIVRARDAWDVVQAVRFARTHGLPLAVRSGGHSMAGHGTVDGGLVVDLAGMKGLSIDPTRRVGWAQPGVTWGEYSARAHEYGLATPAGDAAAVGVGGLTLGGGIGWLARKHGLTIDNLLSVQLVTADGRLLMASADEHADLFWGLRGGGGNLGIATAFQFRLHPVGTIQGGALIYPATREVLRAYAEEAAAAPDGLSTISFVMQAPPLPFIPVEAHGRLIVMITACYAGDLDAGERALAPLRSLAGTAPIADLTGPMPYPALFDLTAAAAVSRSCAVRYGYLHRLDDAIDVVLAYCGRMTSPFGMAELRVLGGAMARVPAEATAFVHRDKPFLVAAINAWDDPFEAGRHVAWTEAFWRALAPYTDGAYAGFLQDEGEERVRDAYESTYARLADLKRRYDPTNLFHLNANVRPAD